MVLQPQCTWELWLVMTNHSYHITAESYTKTWQHLTFCWGEVPKHGRRQNVTRIVFRWVGRCPVVCHHRHLFLTATNSIWAVPSILNWYLHFPFPDLGDPLSPPFSPPCLRLYPRGFLAGSHTHHKETERKSLFPQASTSGTGTLRKSGWSLQWDSLGSVG